jgi:hypothetical protein
MAAVANNIRLYLTCFIKCEYYSDNDRLNPANQNVLLEYL